MKKFILFFIVLLVSCGLATMPPLKSTRDDETFVMKINVVPENKIRDTCAALGVLYESNGCTAFNLDTKVCNIYVMPQRYPDDADRLKIIGHEVWHCRFGLWHD